MSLIFLPIAALALIGATDDDEKDVRVPDATENVVLPLDNPSYFRTSRQAKLIEHAQSEAPPSDEQCPDRMTKAHNQAQETGKPARERASPDKPFQINAVDKRIDGCAVMVMKSYAKDMRPLPAPSEREPGITPAADLGE